MGPFETHKWFALFVRSIWASHYSPYQKYNHKQRDLISLQLHHLYPFLYYVRSVYGFSMYPSPSTLQMSAPEEKQKMMHTLVCFFVFVPLMKLVSVRTINPRECEEPEVVCFSYLLWSLSPYIWNLDNGMHKHEALCHYLILFPERMQLNIDLFVQTWTFLLWKFRFKILIIHCGISNPNPYLIFTQCNLHALLNTNNISFG